MKKPILVGSLAFVVFLFLFGVWFWSLGAATPGEVPPIRLQVVSGKVEYNKSGTSEWKALSSSQDIGVSDGIRVGDDGHAEIQWGDRGVTRLDPKTQVIVEAMPEGSALTQSSLKLHVMSGRIWNRMLKILDLQSTTEVRTDTVVATVRGTSFGVAASGDGLETAVTNSVVDVHTASGTISTLVREGRWGKFAQDGSPEIMRELTDQDSWPRENFQKDQAFDEAYRRAALERLKKRGPEKSGWLSALSEELHLSTSSGERKAEFAGAYAERRLLAAVNGKPEEIQTESFRRLVELARGSQKVWQHYLARLRDAFASVDLGTDMGRKTREALWAVRTEALGTSQSERRYALALVLDDRIDDLVFHPADPAIDRERAASLLKEVDDWQAGSREGVSSADSNRLALKAEAMRERLRGVGQKASETPAPATEPVPTAPTTTTAVPAGSSTTPTTRPVFVPPTPTSTRPVTGTTTACASPQLSLFIKPTTIGLSDTAVLSLYKSCANGSTEDVTTKATYQLSDSSMASIQGKVVYPKKVGRVTITGSYMVDGRVLQGSGTLSISDASNGVKLSGVRVVAQGPTSITTGQRVPLEATAVYSDGSSRGINAQCKWSTSDPRMAMVSNSIFQHLQGTGTVNAICVYTENNVTANGSVTFTVSLDPSLQPKNTRPGYQYPTTYVP